MQQCSYCWPPTERLVWLHAWLVKNGVCEAALGANIRSCCALRWGVLVVVGLGSVPAQPQAPAGLDVQCYTCFGMLRACAVLCLTYCAAVAAVAACGNYGSGGRGDSLWLWGKEAAAAVRALTLSSTCSVPATSRSVPANLLYTTWSPACSSDIVTGGRTSPCEHILLMFPLTGPAACFSTVCMISAPTHRSN